MNKNLFLMWAVFYSAIPLWSQSDSLLWYKQPANHFDESLVLGNGTLGATVFGGVSTDKIYLNDATLWSGEPVNPNMNPTANQHIAAIRAAFAEMLVQSSEKEIRLLPALPDAWSEGWMRGLCARGGFEISLKWANHKLHQINVLAKKGGKTTLTYGDVSINIDLKLGETIEMNW